MKKYHVSLTSETPLLMHADNLEWADKMQAWQKAPDNKKRSVAGDDRTPAWRWLGNIYHDGRRVVLPSDNIMTALREGGSGVLVPGAKGNKTFKAQTQSGIIVLDDWPLLIAGAEVPYGPIAALAQEEDFGEHVRAVEAMGFKLLRKRARVNQSKHVRVRPMFETWSVQGELLVVDDQLTIEALRDILGVAGSFKGVGDWRPSSPKSPGVFGRFTATIAAA